MGDLPKVWLNLKPHHSVFEILDGEAEIIGPFSNGKTGDPLCEIECAHAVLAGSDFPASRDTLNRAGKLRVISRFGIGVDSIDVQAATELGICVVNTPDAHTISVAEHTIGLILATSRNLLKWDRAVRSGEWHLNVGLGAEIHGKTVGLIGFGRIASQVAELLAPFGARILAYDPFVKPEKATQVGVELKGAMEDVLSTSDIVSLHVPLTRENEGLIGEEALSLMKKHAVLINVSRGRLVCEKALANALESGGIAGAGLDVFREEPPGLESPLLGLDNVVLSPHAAAFTRESKRRSNSVAAFQALQALRGECPRFLVNPDVWESRRV